MSAAAIKRAREARAAAEAAKSFVGQEKVKLAQLSLRRREATAERDRLREEKDRLAALELLGESKEHVNG